MKKPTPIIVFIILEYRPLTFAQDHPIFPPEEKFDSSFPSTEEFLGLSIRDWHTPPPPAPPIWKKNFWS